MKQYKGLDVPEMRNEYKDHKEITKQDDFCLYSDCGSEHNTTCVKCLFDESNIDQFKQWLKDKEAGE